MERKLHIKLFNKINRMFFVKMLDKYCGLK